ncbi:hypothetical protein SVAN01_02635 [Stagonosporopsis vannaccii]|nr:hypothetical protein SVAN01_02635 [Stagonosporopsis vannaccii]
MLGPYYDMLGEFEPHTTKYTLTVLLPPRPPRKWLPAFLTRPSPSKPNIGTAFTIRPSDYNPAHPNYSFFEWRHLEDMESKTVTIMSGWFPADLRCDHVQGGHKCEEGCYVLEKGGENCSWYCSRKDCEGHVYCGRVAKDAGGTACFGKKGARMLATVACKMHLYGTKHRYTRQQPPNTDIITKLPDAKKFTLTALVAPVSMTSFPISHAYELHTLEERIFFHIDADKVPEEVRCSCLRSGRYCLQAEHRLLDFGPDSPFWLGEDGKPRFGSLVHYKGAKKGGKSVIIGDCEERICCVAGFGKGEHTVNGSSVTTGWIFKSQGSHCGKQCRCHV